MLSEIGLGEDAGPGCFHPLNSILLRLTEPSDCQRIILHIPQCGQMFDALTDELDVADEHGA